MTALVKRIKVGIRGRNLVSTINVIYINTCLPACPAGSTRSRRGNHNFIVKEISKTKKFVQMDAKLLDVTCCVRLDSLLHVIGCCWELLRNI